MIAVELYNKTEIEISAGKFQKLADSISTSEQISKPQTVTLMLITSDEMRKLNKIWRGRDTATDVLAFPLDFPESELFGDIIIDIETASRQKGNKTVSYELQVLFVHGLLHLLGYDHISARDAEIMKSKEIEYRNFMKE